jgi:hypothetical protein
MRIPVLLLALFVTGCGNSDDRPDKVVQDYLHARDSASCRYLTAPRTEPCRLPHVPEPPADRVVIERVGFDGSRATVRASYDWTGIRRHSTFTLVRRDDDWLITGETPD